jgi:hypothetical protein
MKLRFTVLVLASSIAAAVTAADARPALFFLFDPTTASPGDVVTVRTGNTPAGFEPGRRVRPFQRPIRVYLVPNTVAAEVRSRFDTHLEFVGSLVPDARGRGVLRFRAPPLDSGNYAVAAWCPACARYSGGRAFSVLRVDDDVVPHYRPLMLLRLRTQPAATTCTATIPEGSGQFGSYGNGLLSTPLRHDGALPIRPEPDGSISRKLAWLPSGIGGTLRVRGERLDVPSPPLRVLGVNWGYSSTGRGSWASAVEFPSEGCWRISGRVRDVTLTYVVRVVRA